MRPFPARPHSAHRRLAPVLTRQDRWRGTLAHRVGEPSGVVLDGRPLAGPKARNAVEEVKEIGPRKVGTTPKGPPVRQSEHRHGPTARAGQQLHRLHIHGVYVGPFLPVDLDGHEPGIEHLGDTRVLETFVSHHVAPMASGVPDRNEDRDVPATSLLERLPGPGPPVDGVSGVLKEVRARFVSEPVGAWHGYTLPSGAGAYPCWGARSARGARLPVVLACPWRSVARGPEQVLTWARHSYERSPCPGTAALTAGL